MSSRKEAYRTIRRLAPYLTILPESRSAVDLRRGGTRRRERSLRRQYQALPHTERRRAIDRMAREADRLEKSGAVRTYEAV